MEGLVEVVRMTAVVIILIYRAPATERSIRRIMSQGGPISDVVHEARQGGLESLRGTYSSPTIASINQIRLEHLIEGHLKDHNRRLSLQLWIANMRDRLFYEEKSDQDQPEEIESQAGIRLTGLCPHEGNPRAVVATYLEGTSIIDVINLFQKIGPVVSTTNLGIDDGEESLIIEYETIEDLLMSVYRYGSLVVPDDETHEEGSIIGEPEEEAKEAEKATVTEDQVAEQLKQEWDTRLRYRTEYTDKVRLHVLIPREKTEEEYMQDFMKFGPIEYMLRLPMAKTQPHHQQTWYYGFVKYFDEDSAAEAIRGRPEYKPRVAPPRVLSRNQRSKVRHELCGMEVSAQEIASHGVVCRRQAGRKLLFHHFCGQAVYKIHWTSHLQSCNRQVYAVHSWSIKDALDQLEQFLKVTTEPTGDLIRWEDPSALEDLKDLVI